MMLCDLSCGGNARFDTCGDSNFKNPDCVMPTQCSLSKAHELLRRQTEAFGVCMLLGVLLLGQVREIQE
jgi:hypothetical protein